MLVILISKLYTNVQRWQIRSQCYWLRKADSDGERLREGEQVVPALEGCGWPLARPGLDCESLRGPTTGFDQRGNEVAFFILIRILSVSLWLRSFAFGIEAE